MIAGLWSEAPVFTLRPCVIFDSKQERRVWYEQKDQKHHHCRGALACTRHRRYGLYVTKVDGEEADESQQQWWCFSKDGEDLMTGVDDTMIADGDHYDITLKTGW